MIDTVKYLKKQVGIDVKLCDHFTGIRGQENNKFINIILKDQTCESKDYDLLISYIERYNSVFKHAEPNGMRRVALFFNNN